VGKDELVRTPYEISPVPIGPGERRPVGRLERPVQGRYVGGVCAGLAQHLGFNVRHVRLAFLLISLAGGAGVVAYLFLWGLTPQSREVSMDPRTRVLATGRPTNEPVRNLVVGLGLLAVGGALVAQQRGINLRLGVLIPVLAVAGGAVLAWSQLDDAERGRWLAGDVGSTARRAGLLRLGIGIALATIGVVVLATQGRGLAGLWEVGIPAVAVLAGAAQAQRIRATERADIAAHLHDSVLQTLALIQRKAGDSAEVVRLARAQERELRGWLYAGPLGSQSSLASAVTEVAHDVEDLHGIPIELVVTGDRPLDVGGVALVRALREALLNAVRHGAAPVSVYVEVGSESVEAFVRDHGGGFDLDAVPQDRFGVRESIVGRMSRHGGSAAVRRLEQGTEVLLSLPVSGTSHPDVQPAADVQPDAVAQPGREGTR